MKTLTTITQKGQITIPKEVRQALKLDRPGRVLLEFESVGKTFQIHPVPDLLDLAGTLKPRRHRKMSVLKAREYMEHHYERF